ncbi:MAG TPA: nitroreductase family protein [Acidimicrobiia bacterium]|nr:nitroreductase family protein [Acidimicrobiia bacterium]
MSGAVDAAGLLALMRSQRACRAFRDDPVSDSDVATVLEAATHAPSAENRQPWEFVVVRDPHRRAAIGELILRAWDGGGRRFAEARLDSTLLHDVDAGARGGIASAPVHVVVAVDLERGLEQTIGSSIFPAIQNLLLTATALGLGTALTTIATAFADELSAIAALPRHVRPVAVVPLGWPARALGPGRRAPFAEHTSREEFGTPW